MKYPAGEIMRMMRDTNYQHDQPGEFVAILAETYERPGGGKIRGWRGPQYESELFRRTELEQVDCGQPNVDIEGNWECLDSGLFATYLRMAWTEPPE